MGAQNSPGKIEYTNPATGEVEMLNPVEWMRRVGVTKPAAMVPRQEIQYMGRTYDLRPEEE